MNIKRFVEDDMRQAMAAVRAELGRDAVILSTRRVNGRTEITASADYDPSLSPQQVKQAAMSAAAPASVAAGDGNAPAGTPSIVEIQEELARLRKLFESELSQLAWRELGNREPHRVALLSRLEAMAISRDIGEKIVDKALPCEDLELAWRKAVAMIGRVIRTPEDDIIANGGVIALVGPTGVGKTTTAAKLAAHFALRHGRKQVAFVTSDGYRVGGQEQLISYGSILGIPVQVANNAEEMRHTLASLSERKLVLIDTAGMSQRDMGLAEQLGMLAVEEAQVRPYLVVSATAQESVVNETIKAFSACGLAGAVVTKTDESACLGPVLSALIRHRLPVAFAGNGQRVPDDLVKARPEYFVKRLVQSYQQAQEKPAAAPRGMAVNA